MLTRKLARPLGPGARLLLASILLAGALVARADHCDPRPALPKRTYFGSYDVAKLVALVEPELSKKEIQELLENGCVTVSEWKRRPGALLVAVSAGSLELSPMQDNGKLSVFVLEPGADGKPKIAVRSDPITIQGQPLLFLRFDLAPYEIRPGEIALGLRSHICSAGSQGHTNEQVLRLFRVGEKLVPVLSVSMEQQEYLSGVRILDQKSILIVEKSTTNGFHDLTLKRTKLEGDPKTVEEVRGEMPARMPYVFEDGGYRQRQAQ